MKSVLLFTLIISLFSCTSSDPNKKELWIYTSMYKDTINDLTPRLKAAFPDVKFNWFQAGSEEIATKVNAEMIAGQTKADILISSDRFWYEELASTGKLVSYNSDNAKKVAGELRHAGGFYSTLSIPVMVLCYNKEAVKESDAPKTFKEMTEAKWKNKFTTGSPLASGTNFTTTAMLQDSYGWKYIEGLRKNNTIAQGGNSAVIRRIQNKERPVGWVLLENILRFQGKDERLKVVYPDDGVVFHTNVIAITKKEKDRDLAKKFVDWMYAEEGQKAMTRSYMYSPLDHIDPPKGAPKLASLKLKAFPWTKKFISKVTKERSQIKEKYAQIMFE